MRHPKRAERTKGNKLDCYTCGHFSRSHWRYFCVFSCYYWSQRSDAPRFVKLSQGCSHFIHKDSPEKEIDDAVARAPEDEARERKYRKPERADYIDFDGVED